TFWGQVVVRPFLSVTVQVTTVVPTGKLDGASFTTLATPQLSPVAGAPRSTFPASVEHLPLSIETSGRSSGQVIVGSSVSETVTVTWVEMAAPLSSVAVSTTSLSPTEYGPAGLSDSVTGSPPGSFEPSSTMSGVTAAEHWPGSVPTEMLLP